MRVSLLEMGLSASVLIALTALVRLIAGKRLPRRMFVALWDIAALRLLLPFSLPVRFFPRAAQPALLPAVAQTPVLGGAAHAPVMAQATVAPSPVQSTANRLLSLLPGALRVIWIAGALTIACVFLLRYARCLRAFALSLPDGDARTVRFLREHPLRRRVQVRVSDAIASPLSYGVLRPVILLPKAMDRDDDQALRFVLLHELAHIRALDAVRKPLLLACLCVHWMNPMTAVLLILASRDMELLCDERVLRSGGTDARRAYALTLLSMEERRSAPFPIASGFSRTAIEERIKAMKEFRPKSAVSLMIAALLIFSSCAAFASGDATQNPSVATVFDDIIIVRNVSPSAEAASVSEGNSGFSLVYDTAVDADAALSAEATALVTLGTLGDGIYTLTYASVSDAGAVAEGSPFLSAESWENVYSQYEPYGLCYDAQRGRLTLGGKLVRYFEDMVPVGDGAGSAGTVCSFPDGEVDVFVQRDLDATIVRDADGSYDPMKVYPIVALREDSQEAFDARTAQREQDRAIDIVTANEATVQTYEIYSLEKDKAGAADVEIAYESTTEIVLEGTAENAAEAATQTSDITWWTAEEYRKWLEQERVELQSLVGTGAKAYTPSKGWFEWTQEEVDEAIARYEQILSEIENGAHYGTTADGGILITGTQEKN